MTSWTVLADGLVFGEGPRWRDGALWCSDIHDHRVVRIDLDGRVETVVELPDDRPSGLGWLPDGRLLVVAMVSRRLLALEPDGTLSTHADLARLVHGDLNDPVVHGDLDDPVVHGDLDDPVVHGDLNDMVVRSDGTAYVGHMGSRVFEHGERRTAETWRVGPDGAIALAADGLEAPNGHHLDAGETTLVVAESAASRLTAFDVAPDGSLSGRRTFADLPVPPGGRAAPPDGICGDAEGAVWVADPLNRRVLRVLAGGEVTHEWSTGDVTPVACVVGGADRRSLFVCAAADWRLDAVLDRRSGQVLVRPVDVPGAGAP